MPQINGMGRHTTPYNIPEAPKFYPTWDEFKDFNKFVEYLETTSAPKAGICIVVPPKEWIPRKAGYGIETLNYTINGPVKQSFNTVGISGTYQTKGIIKPAMTVKEYYKLANSHTYKPPSADSYDDLERKYWKSLTFVPPIYGCDVADHLTDPEVKEWNIANLGSTLDLLKEDSDIDIKGVLSPYLYFGMWKATFSWHIEDMDLYAINMVHHGAPKTWYCVPPQYGHLLEKAARDIFPTVASWCSNFMRHKTCMIHPKILDKYGVPYQKVVQEERNIIITFPYAYHCGFNHGFNIAESTNFATPKWIEYGKRSRPCDCNRARVNFSMDLFVKKFQPEKFDDWINKRDIAPHPDDPPEVADEIRMLASDPEAYKLKMEEKRRVKDNRGRHRVSKALDESHTESPLPEETIDVDVYQHHDLLRIVVEVNPVTMKCRGNGTQILREYFNDPEPDVKGLIDKGLLIKIDTRKVPKTKRQRMDDEDEDEDDELEKIDVLIYKHVAADIEAVVDPESLDLVGPQSDDLVNLLNEVNVPLKELIEMGVFRKFIEAKIAVAREPKTTSDSKADSGPPPLKKIKLAEEVKEEYLGPVRKVELHRYKYELPGGRNSLVIKVKPITNIPFYRLSQQAKFFLRGRTVKELIDEGILKFDGSVEVLAKVAVPPPPQATPKIEPSTSATLPATPSATPSATTSTESSVGRKLIACDIYRSKDGKHFLNVGRKTMKIQGRKSDELIKLMDGKSVKELIEAGELIFVSERHVGQQEVKINSDIVFQTLTTTGTENPQRIIVASDGRRIAYLFSGSSDPQRCGILWNGSVPSLKDLRTSESTKIDDSFVIEMSTKRLLSVVLEKVVIVKIEETGESSVNGLEHITPMLHGDADEDVKKAPPQIKYLNSNNAISIQILTETIIVNNESISKNDFLLPVPVKTEITTAEPSNDVTVKADANDVTMGDDSDVEFIEEDDPEEVAKTRLEEAAKVVDVGSESDDDDDEEFYTTESSSESNESSDDPNYGSGRKDGLWNKRSNKSKKRKLKKLRKLKLLSRQDREARRGMGAEERALRRERKTQKRAKAVDARSVADLTRAIVSHLNAKFEGSNPEDSKEFTIGELKEKFNEDRSNIMSVIRIFVGLEINLIKDKDDEDDVYFWYGVDLDRVYNIFLSILNGGKKETENNIWLVFRDFVKVLLLNRKGVRVYPDIIGKSRFGVNETRRVTLSAAILEGLGLLEHKTDSLGGIVWIGKDLFRQWDEAQFRIYSKETPQLKDVKVVVNSHEVTADQLEWAMEAAKRAIASSLEGPNIASGDLSTEQQRSVANQNVVCRCGTTKKMEHEVQRDGKTHNRSKVYVGGKRKMRCKECSGCKAARCKECKNCLFPHLKKPCVQTICLFPVVPKCPCFA